jgi:hypothetical protein
VDTIEMTFFSSTGWESSGTGRMADDDGVNSMLWFRLEGRRCDEALSEDGAEAANSSRLHGKEA